MRVTLYQILTVALGAVALTGCTSFVKVVKATPETNGLRYFLPEPLLLVTPNQDGTISVEPIYLPDPDNEYAIQVTSIFSNYTVDVNRNEKGFLGKVSFNSDNTGVAKQLIESGGVVRVAEINAYAAKKQAEGSSAKAAAASNNPNGGSVSKRTDSTKKKQEAPFENATVDKSLPPNAAAGNSTKNEPKSKENESSGSQKVLKAPQPVFFQIKMSANDVTLVEAFEKQEYRETWMPPKEGDIVLLPTTLVVRPDRDNQSLRAIVKSNTELTAAEYLSSIPTISPTPLFSLLPDKVTVYIEFPKTTPSAQYVVEGKFSDPQNTNVPKSFIVRIER